MSILERVKLGLRVTSSAFDAEISDLIEGAKTDLALAGIANIDVTDPMIVNAIIMYAKLMRGNLENTSRSSSYDAYKRTYDEHKAQLSMSRRYRKDDLDE